MIQQITTSLYDQLIADFELRSILSASSETPDVQALRKDGFAHFKRLGFPNTKVEDWKYVNLSPVLKESFITEPEEDVLSADEKTIENATIPGLDCYKIITINGQFRPELSDVNYADGLYIAPLSAAMNRPLFEAHFGRYVQTGKFHFAALNTALFSNGLYIEVKNKTVVDKPVHIIHIVSAEHNLFIQPRNLFVAGAFAEVSIIETYASASQAKVFVNTVTEIAVDRQANVHHYYIQTGKEQTRYVHHTEVAQEATSVYNNYKASFPGTGLLRNNFNIALDGENIESHLYGIYLAGGQQVVDNHTVVDHRKPHCMSNELYKGVMKDEALAVFNGKIFVREDAQKTNAFQKNNNLMLSKKAVVDSKPQLEIYADDVKCSHGSTIGQFNDDALFYLKARGIGEEKAKALLIHAFAFDVTEKIPLPQVQEYINHLLEEGLK